MATREQMLKHNEIIRESIEEIKRTPHETILSFNGATITLAPGSKVSIGHHTIEAEEDGSFTRTIQDGFYTDMTGHNKFNCGGLYLTGTNASVSIKPKNNYDREII